MCGYEKCQCVPVVDPPGSVIQMIYPSSMVEKVQPSYYPVKDKGLYYVEFNRGGHPGEFTLFKRNYIYSPERWKEILNSSPEGDHAFWMSNEGHPYQLFTGTYGADGCIPDQSWVKWMVDVLNAECNRQEALRNGT